MIQVPGQLALDLFPSKPVKAKSPIEDCMDHLVGFCGCDESRVRPLAEGIFARFGRWEARDRASCLGYFYGDGRHAIPRLQACPPSVLGVDDARLDYHTVWDRCWAARFIPLAEALEVMEWRYTYRKPYTGEPEYVWYTDMAGREVKRRYEA